jgi:large subunit ribosomal protein L31
VTQHPMLHVVDVACSTCGTLHQIRTTASSVSVETCSNCHPAYTGVTRAAVSGSRIERFNRRRSLAVA